MRKIVVNAMGEQCPIPVVKAKKAMAEFPQAVSYTHLLELSGIPMIICIRLKLSGIPMVTRTSVKLRKFQFPGYRRDQGWEFFIIRR